MPGMRGTLAATAVLALVAGCRPADPPIETGLTNTAIYIGIEGHTGGFASDEENLGMMALIAHVNARGGVHGRRLVPLGYPRGGGAAIATQVANARRLMDEDQVFLLFNHGGPGSVEIAALAMAREVPYLFPHTALVTSDADRYVFTSYPRYLGESQVMLRYLTVERGFTRLAIVHDENVYGSFFLNELRGRAAGLGYEVTGAHGLTDRDPGNLAPALAALRDGRPEAVILAVYPEQARRVLEAKAALDWQDVRMVSSGPLTDEQYLNVEGGAAEGTLGFCHFPDPNTSDAPGMAAYRDVMAAFEPDRPINRYSLYGYVFGRLVVEGLTRAGRELTREGFIDAMESIRDWDSGGILPPVTFSADNHHAQRAGLICELREGRFVALTDWIEP
jgi:branched-chain amino acid transport system substrate-binding protein